MSKTYSISDLAKELDITTRTIRFYEAEGLLHPTRSGQTRIYDEQDRVHLKLILRGKRLGFSLAESKELITLYDPNNTNRKQLNRFMEKITERRVTLTQQLEDIKVMQHELDDAEIRCLEALNSASN
jgi:DNA-binding transcriptional MerR regulator